MPIRVSCSCGFVKDVPDQWAGKRAKCKCGRPLEIPGKSASHPDSILDPSAPIPVSPVPKPKISVQPQDQTSASPADSLRFAIETDHPVRKRQTQRKRKSDHVIGIAIGSVVLIVGAVAIWAKVQSPSEENVANDGRRRTNSSMSTDRSGSSQQAETLQPVAPRQTTSKPGQTEVPNDQLLIVIQQPAVSRMLKVTESQQQAIQSILQKHAMAMSDLGSGDDTAAQIRSTTVQLNDTLTSRQKTQLSEMLNSPDGFLYEDDNTKVIVTGPVPEGTPMTRWSASVDGISLAEISDGPIDLPECFGYVVPKRPSHFIALQTGTHKDYTYSIFDLRSQQTLAAAELDSELLTDHEDVSADGTRYAFTKSVRNPNTGKYQYWLGVGNFGDDSAIEIPIADGATGVQFADNRTLIARQKKAKTLAVVDIASKQVKHRISYPQRQADEYLVSPGGKYLFVSRAVRNLFVDVYEVHTGKRVGSLVAPTDGEHYVFLSMTISPNGKYLALGSYRAYQKGGSQVAVWDMETGKLALKLDRRSPFLRNVSKQSAIITNDGTTVLGMNTAVDRTGTKIIWRRHLDPQLGPPRAHTMARNQKFILIGRNAEVFSLPQGDLEITGAEIPKLRPEHALTFAFMGNYLGTAFPKMEFTPEQAERIHSLSEPLLQMKPLLIEGKVAPETWKAKCVEVGGAIIETLNDDQKFRHWDSLSSGSSSFFDLDAETARLQPKP